MILGLYDHTVQVVRLIIHTYSVQCESLTGKLAGLTYPPRRYTKKGACMNLFLAYVIMAILFYGVVLIITRVTTYLVVNLGRIYTLVKERITRDNS